MTLIKRSELQTGLPTGSPLLSSQVFLFFGERFLCQEAADLVQARLLAGQPGAVHAIDGDREDPGMTLAKLMSFSLLPGRQIFRVSDSRILHSRMVVAEIWAKAVQAMQANRPDAARKHLQSVVQAAGLKLGGPTPFSEIPAPEWQRVFSFDRPADSLDWADRLLGDAPSASQATGTDLVDRYIEAFTKGIPGRNFLLLTAETVDKRQRLFTFLKKTGLVVDCSVATGASAAAQAEQRDILREMMEKTLAEFKKKIEPQAVEMFFERVGFHPVAVVVETEKLVHAIGDRPVITCQDLEEMVSRNREDALYQLTDALGKRQADRTLTTLSRLLDQGIHELAVLSTLRSHIRKLLIFRSLQTRPFPTWRSGMNARDFQNGYLPALKAEGEWSELLQGHPYALFMSFTKAGEYSCAGLKRWLAMLLEAEFRLKGSGLPARLVLEELLVAMLKGAPKIPGKRDSLVY